MKRVRKIAIGLVACVCSVLILLLAAALIVPPLVDKTALGGKVRREVSSLIGGEFDFSGVSFSVLPSPHVGLESPRVVLPNRLSASARSVEVYPEIIPLLSGRFALKKAIVMQPDATIWIPASTDGPRKHPGSAGLKQLPATLVQSLSRLPQVLLPFFYGTISQGSFRLIFEQNPPIILNRIDAVVQNVSDSVTLAATATSNMLEKIAVTGKMHTSQPNGSAHITVDKLKIDALSSALFPGVSLPFEDAAVDISVDLLLKDAEHIDLKFKGSAPHVRLVKAGQKADIELRTLSGSVTLDPDSALFTISELVLDKPGMHVSGSLGLTDESHASLHLEGRDVDISSTRAVASALAGPQSVVQTIFSIVRGGRIPVLSVSGEGNALSDLADLDNLVLHASLAGGEIDVPGAGLGLTEVSGDVSIIKGILTGEKILAHWQQSTAKNGMLQIDLTKDPLPMHVQAGLDVAVSDIPAILTKFIDDQTFKSELGKFADLQGRATGTLSLTGTSDQLAVDVSATDINLSAHYDNIPYPLMITAGGVRYDGNSIKWQQLDGSLGTSNFAAISGELDLGRAKHVTITSGSSRMVIPDLLPWFSSLNGTREIAGYYGGGRGILLVSAMSAEGSLSDFGSFVYNLEGQLDDLTIKEMPMQPGPLTIGALKWHANQKQIEFSDGRLGMLDGSISASGSYLDYRSDGQKRLSLDFEGRIGPQLAGWISDKADMPAWIKLHPLSIRNSHLNYSKPGRHKISAALALQDDLAVSTELSLADNSVIVETLILKDQASQASFTGTKLNRIVDVSFDGILHGSTIGQIAEITPGSDGSINGKATVSVDLENPHDFSLVGDLNGTSLSLPLRHDSPVKINTAALSGSPDTITISAANVSWRDTDLSLSGKVKRNPSGPMTVALAVEAGVVDVDAILGKFGNQSSSEDKKTGTTTFPLPFQGHVSFKVNKLQIRNFSIQKLHADVQVQNDGADLALKEMELCGIPASGTVSIAEQNFAFHLKPDAHNGDLNATLNCFADEHFKADGTFNITGLLEGNGRLKDLPRSTAGELEVSIVDGHVYHDIILLNVLKFLNVTQVLTGQISARKMVEKGVGFNHLQVRAELHEGKIKNKGFVLDADEIKLSGIGEIDIPTKQIDFTLLVAPLTMVNSFLGHMPLIGGVMQTITAIPLLLAGKIDDVHVLPLAPSAVGHELKEVMKQTLGIPLQLMHLDNYKETFNRDQK